jgi:hypothetical protein
MTLAYLGQTPEVPRTDLRAKHHLQFSIATLIIGYNGLTMSINSATTSSLAATNYITIFDKEEVNIYDANDTIIAVTRRAILQG